MSDLIQQEMSEEEENYRSRVFDMIQQEIDYWLGQYIWGLWDA